MSVTGRAVWCQTLLHGNVSDTAPEIPSSVEPLAVFSPVTRAWFERTFDAPTPAQEKGWPVIASGANTLIQAPTGSGKTLAAFLYAIDRLSAETPAARDCACSTSRR